MLDRHKQHSLDSDKQQITALRDAMATYCGVYLDAARLDLLAAHVATRCNAIGLACSTYATYTMSVSGQAELAKLAELVLNHETVFFRNKAHFRALRDVLLPQFRAHAPQGRPLRIWSAGCASGEEAYSLAIVALEALGMPPSHPIEIWASDLSQQVLAKARSGCYQGRSLNNLTTEQHERYFQADGAGNLCVREEVRQIVNVVQLNLLEPFPATLNQIDIIFCQNVTIYFQIDTCRKLLQRFYDTLANGGLLFLGFSETLWHVFDAFHWREIAGASVYYKESQNEPSTTPWVRNSTARATQPAAAQHNGVPVVDTLRAVAVVPPIDAAALDKGRALLADGDAERVLQVIYQRPITGVHAPAALALVAQAHADRGATDLAIAEAQRAVALDPRTTEAYMLLGLLYTQQEQLQPALDQFMRARFYGHDSALVAFHLAGVYRRLQQPGAALREYRMVLHKLVAHPPNDLIDGVAVSWIRETCRRYITILTGAE